MPLKTYSVTLRVCHPPQETPTWIRITQRGRFHLLMAKAIFLGVARVVGIRYIEAPIVVGERREREEVKITMNVTAPAYVKTLQKLTTQLHELMEAKER